ncbi:MAG: glucose 1-dehydrogenase [Alphaproteobacteria bacterium]|nr:glucose 1-dehydrogenase [Alphaproteobacteria bacterium]|tara:strand:+ start:1984 stop:2736 length:753 start_codon:yes stop_codon:yes gene_type:complete
MAESEAGTAIVIGVGAEQGTGAAVARRFAAGGMHTVLAGRTAERLEERQAEIAAAGGTATVHVLDVRKEDEVAALFAAAETLDGTLRAVVFNPGANVRYPLAETETWLFEHLWRVSCFGGFLVTREATERLAANGGGSLLFTGATGSMRGANGHAAFAAAKAGLRMVAQSAAREYGPRGVHVAHVIVDGAIDGEKIRQGFPQRAEEMEAKGVEDTMLDPEAIAEAFWQLHLQPRSAWTHELDMRPWVEDF